MFYALGSVGVSVAPYLWAILALFAVSVLVLASAALLDSESELPLVRLTQGLRLSGMRMGRMLRQREIPIARYAGALSVATLKRQADTCAGCEKTELCDRALARTPGPNSHTHYSFCPNQPAIEHFLAARTPAAN